MSPRLTDEWLTPYQVAGRLDVSIRTLADWRRRKTGPVYLQISYRTLRYPSTRLEEWLQTQLKTTKNYLTTDVTARISPLLSAPAQTNTVRSDQKSRSRFGRHSTREDIRREQAGIRDHPHEGR